MLTHGKFTVMQTGYDSTVHIAYKRAKIKCHLKSDDNGQSAIKRVRKYFDIDFEIYRWRDNRSRIAVVPPDGVCQVKTPDITTIILESGNTRSVRKMELLR